MAAVADAQPAWGGSVVAMPRHAQGAAGPKLSADEKRRDADVLERYAIKRRVSLYDSELQAARHIHVPAQGKHRLLQHHYSFAFFADPAQRSFYRRMVRDYMRYRDPIQCAGARLVDAVRDMSRKLGHADGAYYALHIRRGDFQYKDVKISAAQIVKNLRGHEIIVYVATDDPDGTCQHCLHDRKPCPKGACLCDVWNLAECLRSLPKRRRSGGQDPRVPGGPELGRVSPQRVARSLHAKLYKERGWPVGRREHKLLWHGGLHRLR
jgi:hypothetical protein